MNKKVSLKLYISYISLKYIRRLINKILKAENLIFFIYFIFIIYKNLDPGPDRKLK